MEVANYKASLNRLQITDQSVVDFCNQRNTKNLWIVLILTPLAIFGKIIWWLPARLSIWIADKTVTRIDFYTSVLSGVLGFVGFFWWLLLLTLTYNIGIIYMQFIALFLPLFSYVYMQWDKHAKNMLAGLRLKQLMKVKHESIEQLIQQRNQIVAY